MEFLIAYMPQQDLQTLTADFLLEHVTYVYKAWHQSPWEKQISEDLFLNNIFSIEFTVILVKASLYYTYIFMYFLFELITI